MRMERMDRRREAAPKGARDPLEEGGVTPEPREGGEGSWGPGGVRDQLRTAQGHLTWVLVTGHLLVLGIQRPRRPGLFPQLHVWVPVKRGGDGRTVYRTPD